MKECNSVEERDARFGAILSTEEEDCAKNYLMKKNVHLDSWEKLEIGISLPSIPLAIDFLLRIYILFFEII